MNNMEVGDEFDEKSFIRTNNHNVVGWEMKGR